MVLVVIGSVFGGLVLAVALAAFLDLRRGVLLERWQIGRQLELAVLGEVPQV